MIELKNIEAQVLKKINLKVNAGEFISIVGGNGAGKSTLMNVIGGNLLPQRGQIWIDEFDVTRLPQEKRAKNIARIFQDPLAGSFANLTLEENLKIASQRGQKRGLSLKSGKSLREKIRQQLSSLGLGLEKRLHDKAGVLSGGQRQALSLIMACLAGCKILLLDEHTAALDPKTGAFIMDLTHHIIKTQGLTALMITHSMPHAIHYGDRVLLMREGQFMNDIHGEEKRNLTPKGLLAFFE